LGRWAAFFNQVPIICHTPHGHVYYAIFFLMAGREILAQKPKALFCFFGSGPLKEELETKAKAWGISHRVRFIPWEPDPAPILALFDIFVLPSLNEGMGRAIVEAMAMKKPV